MLKVLVADDHPLFREAVILAVRLLDGSDPEIFEAGTLDETSRLAAAIPDLDLLILDLRMPDANGLSGLVDLRRRFPALPILIVSASEEPRLIREAIAAGAMAYVPKSLDRATMDDALRRVLAGEIWQPEEQAEGAAGPSGATVAQRLKALTVQQDNVLRLMVAGKPNKLIASSDLHDERPSGGPDGGL